MKKTPLVGEMLYTKSGEKVTFTGTFQAETCRFFKVIGENGKIKIIPQTEVKEQEGQ